MSELLKGINPDFDAIFSDADSAKGFLTQVADFLDTLVRYISQLFKAFGVKPYYADPTYDY